VGGDNDGKRCGVAPIAERDGATCETMNRQCVNADGIVSSSVAIIAGDAKCATERKC